MEILDSQELLWPVKVKLPLLKSWNIWKCEVIDALILTFGIRWIKGTASRRGRSNSEEWGSHIRYANPRVDLNASEKTNILLFPRIKSWYLGLPGRSLVTVSTVVTLCTRVKLAE